jgi:hypothetical protein
MEGTFERSYPIPSIFTCLCDRSGSIDINPMLGFCIFILGADLLQAVVEELQGAINILFRMSLAHKPRFFVV